MKYLEIYPIENCADKISEQLDEIVANSPRMYSKTKNRYKQLAISLLQSVEKITNILESDSLANLDSDEFDNKRTNEHNIEIDDISAAMKQASDRVNEFETFISSNQKITSSVNKDTLSRYAEIIDLASKHDFKFYEVNQCVKIIHDWFFSRFVPEVKNPKFKYNISQIPRWISNIIILYGKYLSQHKSYKCSQLFDNWCEAISNDTSNTWAVPYEVYELDKHIDPSNYTMEAVIIGDILMDEVFYQLTEEHSPGLVCNLECYPVVSIVKLNNPSLLPKIRTRLAKRDELIEEYKLTESEGGN